MNEARERFRRAFAQCSLVAVLRGVRPDEVESVADALVEAGIVILEVPLNSPDPYDSIARLARRHGRGGVVGAGTVLTTAEVTRVAEAGGALAVSPNTDAAVVAAAVDAGLVSLPGYFTASEAFTACAAGAHGLKLFPAEGANPAMLKAHRAVLPQDTVVLAVGGITPQAMPAWRAAGADGFGLGSSLYRPGKLLSEIAADAATFVAAARTPQ